MASNDSIRRDSFSAASLVIDDFLPAELALAMRQDIAAHFAEPHRHRPETHQVWNYWFVPDLYTYLRTQPEKIIARERVDQFIAALGSRSVETLGLAKVSWPYLSLYVDGCRQGLHNDSRNGRFAYVYSLTDDARRGSGGETILLRPGDLFRSGMRGAQAGTGLYEAIVPRFNRLVLFDDRLVHGVERVEGAMDPLDGRFVLHGHIEESGPLAIGALPADRIAFELNSIRDDFLCVWSTALAAYHGLLVLSFTITPEGRAASAHVRFDRVICEEARDPMWEPLKRRLLERLADQIFPTSDGETNVLLPVVIGGAL